MLYPQGVLFGGMGALVAAVSPGSFRDERSSGSSHRKRILEEIQRSPGIHYRELRRRLRAANGDLSHHLRELLRAGEVVSARSHGRLHFFPSGFQESKEAFALTDRCRQVLQLLRLHPGATETEVMHATGLSLGWTSDILHCLQAEEWVRSIRAGRQLRWYPLR